MIELKNVSKTYTSRKSKNTKALNDISLTLNDNGMTFILGKSGSGKSTLLNILGGLDKYDSGEMIIMGKSTKTFTQKDYDSYRNTYVGFIFQEFNILEDYDVSENIKLALQLQQKEVNEKELEALLSKLELSELTKRKVNELSGGQKQRVAIARALVKKPKIILADEPTGNLDSKTGRQVIELLKEISKETLVVVVSHDEEYANKYGDRILEIKDGQIINDSNEIKINSNNNDYYKIIKSHLPLKDSFKLGFGSLKHKKIKLFFTILLTIITLGFLSCIDTLSSYNFSETHAQTLVENNEQFIQIEKKHIMLDEFNTYFDTLLPFDEESKKEVKNKLGKNLYDVYHVYIYNEPSSNSNILHIQEDAENYYYENPAEIVVTNDINKILKDEIIGSNPKNKDEIVISNYLANKIIKNGIEVHETVYKDEFKESKIYFPKTYQEILDNKYTYYFGDKAKIKIVGIINYDLTDNTPEYIDNVLLKSYVNSDFIDNIIVPSTKTLKTIYELEALTNDNINLEYLNSASILNHEIEYYNGFEWIKSRELKDNEIIVSMQQLVRMDANYFEELNKYINNSSGDYTILEKKFTANYINNQNIIGKSVNLKIYYSKYLNDVVDEFKDLKIVGVVLNDKVCESNNTQVQDCIYYDNNYISGNVLESYIGKSFDKSSVLIPMTDKKEIKEATDMFPVLSELAIKSTYSERLYSEKLILDAMKTLATYVGIVFLAFTIFLISNFMFTSLSYRKKEIGILRALGSRNLDIVKILLWEAFTLSIISATIASILLVIVSNLMNKFILSQVDMLTVPFVVGIRQFLVIYLLVFMVTIISSLLPILKISKMKPIDAILNK